MARFKELNYQQAILVPVVYARQILPRIFPSVLKHLIDCNIKFDHFMMRYRNDDNGAAAHDPRPGKHGNESQKISLLY